MIMTREQAAEVWCPHSRVWLNNTTVNRSLVDPAIDMKSCCKADGCAMWRWITREDANTAEQIRTNKGYCGLAGRPMA